MTRVKLTNEEFEAITHQPDALLELYETLILKNPAVVGERGPSYDAMTEGQRALATLIQFQMEIFNGGLRQYLFNRPLQLDMLLDALPIFEWPELQRQLEGILSALPSGWADSLVDAKRAFNVQMNVGKTNEGLSKFRDWASTIDASLFDAWFYANEATFSQRMLSMVRRRRAELIAN